MVSIYVLCKSLAGFSVTLIDNAGYFQNTWKHGQLKSLKDSSEVNWKSKTPNAHCTAKTEKRNQFCMGVLIFFKFDFLLVIFPLHYPSKPPTQPPSPRVEMFFQFIWRRTNKTHL